MVGRTGQAGEFGRPQGTLPRARRDQDEGPGGEPVRKSGGLFLPGRREWHVCDTGVPTGPAPPGLAMAEQHEPT